MTDRASTVEVLRAAHDGVLARIAAAAERVGRDPAEVTLVAVTKTVSADRVSSARAAGITTFGENRVQETLVKQRELGSFDGTWHLVGPLQSNKARKAIDAFDVIETVDSTGLARRIDLLLEDVENGHQVEPAWRYPILLQVNVDDDPAKAGFRPDGVEPALREIASLRFVRVDGLMTVGRLNPSAEDARPTFRALRELSKGLRDQGLGIGSQLSMGMSEDFEVAVEEGATIVRVGRALFGERPHHHGHGPLEHTQ